MNTALFMRQNPSMAILQARRRLDENNLRPPEKSLAATTPPSAMSTNQPALTLMDLPAEIRTVIWRAAIPRRVVLCPLLARHSSMPQPLSSLCYESREVIMQTGRWIVAAEDRSVWLSQHDTLLLDSPQGSDYLDPSGYLDEAARGGGTIAVPYDLLRRYHTGRAVFPFLSRLQTGQETLVYFDKIVVTGTRAQALASGLFDGTSSPEERLAFVKLSDQTTLRWLLSETDAGLTIGNRGFLRELLLPSHAMHNVKLLANAYLQHKQQPHRDLHQWREMQNAEIRGELEEGTIISMALDEGMPSLEQAVLLVFEERI